MSDLERRVRELEDVEEIRRLKWRYCRCWDVGWSTHDGDGDGLAALFAEDGVWDGRPLAATVLRGRDAIRSRPGALAWFMRHHDDGTVRAHPVTRGDRGAESAP